jgi:hypothetical protein
MIKRVSVDDELQVSFWEWRHVKLLTRELDWEPVIKYLYHLYIQHIHLENVKVYLISHIVKLNLSNTRQWPHALLKTDLIIQEDKLRYKELRRKRG